MSTTTAQATNTKTKRLSALATHISAVRAIPIWVIFLIMPTQGALQLNPGVAANPKGGYRSAFSHANEVAEAGYYKVKLDDDGILAELTASNRVGFHQYTFPKSDQSHIVLDLAHGIYNYDDKVVWTFVRVVNDTLITGVPANQWLGADPHGLFRHDVFQTVQIVRAAEPR